MTRTFRRTNRGVKTDYLPDAYKSEEYKELFVNLRRWTARYNRREEFLQANRIWDRFCEEHPEYNDWFLGFGEPGPRWFRNAHTTRPRRAKERLLCKKLKDGYYDYDEVVFPRHGRPQIYWT